VHLDPRHLATLEAVVRLGSFSAAATSLGYTQSAVSQQIGELERRTGLRVLDRRPIRPTAAGRVLLQAEIGLRQTLVAAATELRALEDGVSGSIRVGAFVSAGASFVPDALARLHADRPGLELTLVEVETGAAHEALLRGDLDLAVTYDYDRFPQPVPDGLVRRLLLRDPVRIVLPVGHRLTAQTSLRLTDPDPDEWIATPVTAPGHELLGEQHTIVSAEATISFHGDDFRTATRLVAANLGVALLPTLALAEVSAAVTSRPLDDSPLTRFVYSCRLDTRRVPSAVQRLETHLDHAAANIAKPSDGA
jgi:DNA-binding transcriptional LysR family regulator